MTPSNKIAQHDTTHRWQHSLRRPAIAILIYCYITIDNSACKDVKMSVQSIYTHCNIVRCLHCNLPIQCVGCLHCGHISPSYHPFLITPYPHCCNPLQLGKHTPHLGGRYRKEWERLRDYISKQCVLPQCVPHYI